MDSSGNPQQIPLAGGFNMFKCLGNELLQYSNSDLTTGIYLDFMIRASSASSTATNTIFAYQIKASDSSAGTPFFRVAYNPSDWKIFVEMLDSTSSFIMFATTNSIVPGYSIFIIL